MSYNIDSTSVTVFSNVYMRAGDILRLRRLHGDQMPEDNFITDLADSIEGERLHPDAHVTLPPNLPWRCARSGHMADFFFSEVAPCIMGSVDAVFIWEGGDSFSGFRIRDGKVTFHEVVLALGAEIAK